MQHLKGFGLENFRVFKDYTWFDFAPITLLIGPNNSGKSSLIKALLLLKENIQYGRVTQSLDFKSSLHNLSGWDGVINDKKDNKITFEYLSHYVGNSEEPPNVTEQFKRVFIEPIANEYTKNVITRHEYQHNRQFYSFFYTNIEHKCIASFSSDYRLFVDSQYLSLAIQKVLDEIESNKLKYIYKENVLISTLKEVDLNKWLIILKSFNDFLNKKKNWEINLWDKFNEWKKGNLTKEFYNFLQTHAAFHSQTIEPNLLITIGYLFEDFLNTSPIIEDFSLLMEILAYTISYNPNSTGKIASLSYLPAIKGVQKRLFLKGDNHPIANLLEKEMGKSKTEFIKKWGQKFNISDFIVGRNENHDYNYVEINNRALADLGYGISQLASVILSFGEEEIFILEEPESNLHPKFQSLLADLFTEQLYETKLIGSREGEYEVPKSVQFIIETHSEYMVRKFQYLVAKGEVKKEDIVIYYFHDPKENKQPTKITIDEYGGLSDDFGSGFFDEATNWKFELLQLRKAQKN
ncbi:MAG: DUF3696 domain-containing protein [Emticicia sp.]